MGRVVDTRGNRPHPEEIKRDGWRDQRILVVHPDDPRLSWPEKEMVEYIGNRLYGENAHEQKQA